MGASLLSIGRIKTVVVIPQTPLGLAEAWQFDVVTDMSENNPGTAFRHPLQNGQEGITDGTRLEPPEFSVEGVCTDTPVRFLSPRLIGILSGILRPHPGAVALYDQIKEFRSRQVPCTVITSWAGVLTNRWPEVIQGSHGAADGASIRMSINFVRFRLVSTVPIPSLIDSDNLLLGAQTTVLTQTASG